ncbi:Lin1244/Lin1753 domain-containing protein [Thalassobellus suaedae]|uniref:DUF4373 domain-containing protein n=1 Tax=Thalassobellus suaedae TaxID=3074124 RepID=A0ABY9XVR6_9FLAO|nr:DUF4373 domain-containing protein [Flavobacteriaceae bacterium HL-DH14]
MARPEKNTVDYFPFICAEGKKMFYLEETYGNDGFAAFVKLLRELANTDFHYLNLSKKTTLMFLSAKCKISTETLLNIINDLVDLEKFDEVLWKENRIVWCQDFIDGIQDAYKKRNNECITYEGLLSLLISLGIRKPNKSKSKEPVNPQSKVKKIKEDKSKEDIEERKLKFSSTLEPFLTTYGKDFLNEFFKYWTEPNKSNTKFRQELEKTWSLERRLETWAKNDKNFKKAIPQKQESFSTNR